MKLAKDARILTADGRDIGNLNRFVMDPRSKQVTHVVFETRGLQRDERVIPMQLVQQVDEQGIHLRPLEKDDPENFDRFEVESYLVADEDALIDQGTISDQSVRSYYYYPPAPFGASGILRPTENYINAPFSGGVPYTGPGVPVSGESPVVRQVDQHIPDGTVALKEGAKVLTSDSKHVGNVEKVLIDPKSSRASHLMITKGLLFKERKVIPTDWIDTILEDEVHLGIDSQFAQRLPDYRQE